MADDSGRESVDEIVSSSLLVLSVDHAAHEALDLHVAGWNTDDEGDTPASSEVVEQDQEESVGATEEMLDDAEIDQLLLAASQEYGVTGEEVGSARRRFGSPVSSAGVEEARKFGVPPKTRRQTSWACGVWASWVRDRTTLPVVDPLEGNHELGEDINSMSIKALQFWLPIAK